MVCSIFPPDAQGGAELSAYHLSRWLLGEGHEVSVLTTAKTASDELWGVDVDGMRMWRIFWPRPYAVHTHEGQPMISKILWHLQDHLDPRNSQIVTKVVDAVRPEFIHLHLVAGIGHNALSVFNNLKHVPVIYFLHDMGLACIRSTMYQKGKNCERRCAVCRTSSFLEVQANQECQEIYIHFTVRV